MLLLCCIPLSAATIVVNDVDRGRGESIWIVEDGQKVDAYFAGVILISLNSAGKTVDRDTLCVDLFTDIYITQTYGTTVLHPYEVSGKNLERVSWLVDNALLPTESSYASALPQDHWVTSPALGAGIQLAIWDIVHDNGDGLTSGRVQAAFGQGSDVTDPAVVAAAEYYEAMSLGQSSTLAYIYDNVILGNGVEAQMLAGPRFDDGGPVPNPEPATMILVGAALVFLGGFTRCKKNRATAAAE
jgi:hypothetical protein